MMAEFLVDGRFITNQLYRIVCPV